jgi:hypothetical protein
VLKTCPLIPAESGNMYKPVLVALKAVTILEKFVFMAEEEMQVPGENVVTVTDAAQSVLEITNEVKANEIRFIDRLHVYLHGAYRNRLLKDYEVNLSGIIC